MIKAAGFAVLCSGGFAAIVAIDAGRSASPPATVPPAQMMIAEPPPVRMALADTAPSQDTLTLADRFDIAFFDVVATGPEPHATPPDATPSPPPVPKNRPKIANRPKIETKGGHEVHAAKRPAASPPPQPVKRAEKSVRDKPAEPKKTRNADRGKPAAEPRTCPQPEGFAALLRALNLSRGCAT